MWGAVAGAGLGVQRVQLDALNVNLGNVLVVGVIIAKTPPRVFSKKSHVVGGAGGAGAELRGVTSFTLRDSPVDAINCDLWGSEYFALTFYERFLVGDVVEITTPKICVKQGNRNEGYRPQVSSPFFLSLNEGHSDVCVHTGGSIGALLRLLHVPSKPPSGYHGLADLLKITGYTELDGEHSRSCNAAVIHSIVVVSNMVNENTFVDLLVVVKSVGATKNIKTKAGSDMSVRSVELMDNTTPATIQLDAFDSDTIQRASEWTPLESVLFIADARVTLRMCAIAVRATGRTVLTHQPHTSDAEALRLYAQNLANTRGPSGAAAWAAWGAESAGAASVAQVRDRLRSPAPFSVTLHALLTHLELDSLEPGADANNPENEAREVRVRLADHTGELAARMDARVLEEPLGHTVPQMLAMSREERAALRWRVLLERCCARVAACPPRVLVLALRRATAQDAIPLY